MAPEGQRLLAIRSTGNAQTHDIIGLNFLDEPTGIAGGPVLAWLTGTALRGALYGVGSLDAASFATALTLLVAAGYLAAYLPARRAARVNPVAVLGD